MFDESIYCCSICGNILPIFGECPVCKREKETMIDEMYKKMKKRSDLVG